MGWSVVIADDFKMSRIVFENAVELSDDFTLAASVENAEKALEYLSRHPADLLILDVVMAEGQSGLLVAGEVKQRHPQTRILMVTSMPEVSFLQRAREIGVESFWYKEVQEQPITEMMRRTMQGESIYPDSTPVIDVGQAKSTDFTAREIAVLRELSGGASNSEIAERLQITERTVKMHITNMLQKTGFRTRLELAIRARTGGLVIPEA